MALIVYAMKSMFSKFTAVYCHVSIQSAGTHANVDIKRVGCSALVS